jgi:hypothetical protein
MGRCRSWQTTTRLKAEATPFLKRLVDLYYESGQDAFDAALNDSTLDRSERSIAMSLKADAEYEKMPTIDLAKKRFADAVRWHASGIF